MLRAKPLIAAALIALAMMALSAPARAQGVDYIDGVGLIDYRGRPKLEIGSWVRYHITSESEGGTKDDYYVTLLVAGEERFWDEDCFWLETWTERGGSPQPLASLVSFDIFEDPEQYIYAKYYTRKSISDISDAGGREATINKFPPKALQSRDVLRPAWSFDTLGTEQIEVEAGTFTCTKYEVLREGRSTRTRADSTSTTVVLDRRTDFCSAEVPITGLVRQDIRLEAERRYVPTGDANTDEGRSISDVSIGVAELVGYGKGGLEPLLVIERYRKPIREQEREKRRKRKS